MNATSPSLYTNSAEVSNSSNSITSQKNCIELFLQDEELLSIYKDLKYIKIPENINVSNRIQRYFSSDTVFDLSKKVLSETEMKVVAKGLDFAPIQNKINEPKLRNDLEGFCKRMRIKWHFSNDATPQVSEIPEFTPKSKWKSPKGNSNLEVFLNQIEK